jgi:glyoxylase-like metal-dependent hydrolase (beta-lactamase superfamily II)/8-oxo-dGTP pyrophosphatase MutT (NUDIX family)
MDASNHPAEASAGVAPPTPAASVLLARGHGSPEVFLIKRGEHLRFFGGFWAFPGGKLAADDILVPSTKPVVTDAAPVQARRAAAARELFEETGVLVARHPAGTFPAPGPELERWRHELNAGRTTFLQALSALRLALSPDDFALIGDVTTPAFTPLRYETTFYVAHLPPGQEPEVWPGELAEGHWSTAADMLARWTRGECLLSPPTIMTLQAISGRAADEAPIRLGGLLSSLTMGRIHPIFFAPAVQMIPLRTQGLPPSTHTNAYLVGTGPMYLIDPGPAEEAEQQRLFDVLDDHRHAGRRLTAVVLSHHHPDHIGAANVCAERYQVPIWAHAATAEKLKDRITISRTLADGARLDLGTSPAGGSWHLETVYTPGHARGHLAFYEPHYRLLFAGDMVSTISSVVIAPPEGDLAVYLQSLDRLRAFDCRLLLPSHGNVSARPGETLADCIAHRVKREQQLVEALASGPRTIDDLAPELYKGLPPPLMRFAKMQILAGLLKLERENWAEREDGEKSWRLKPGEPL